MRVYLDNNATTMVDPDVRDRMIPFFSGKYGNPNSLHSYGMEVRAEMDRALDMLYAGINASEEDDIIVNGCATEGNNTVLKYIYFNNVLNSGKNRILTTSVEHPSVSKTLRFLEKAGVRVDYMPVNKDGIVTLDILREYLDPDNTALVSVMWANNETGLIMPVKKLAEYTKEAGVLFHTDAVQAIGKIGVDMNEVPADYMTFSAHKFHGPKGVGGLYVRRGAAVLPLLHGGEQMGDLRAGTVDAGGMVGMAAALEKAVSHIDYENTEVRRLRDRLEDSLLSIRDVMVIGDRSLRTPNTILASFKGIEGEAFAWEMNKHGIAVSTGSACASESLEADPTLKAMDLDPELAHTAIRFSLSRFNTDDEIDYTVKMIEESVRRLRSISIDY